MEDVTESTPSAQVSPSASNSVQSQPMAYASYVHQPAQSQQFHLQTYIAPQVPSMYTLTLFTCHILLFIIHLLFLTCILPIFLLYLDILLPHL